MLASSDPVGRLGWVAQGLYGEKSTWRGASLAVAVQRKAMLVGLGGRERHRLGVGAGLDLVALGDEHPRRPVIPTGRAGSLFNKLKNWYRGEF